MKIAYCLECDPPRVLAVGSRLAPTPLPRHVLANGVVHKTKTKVAEIKDDLPRRGEPPQAYLDRIQVEHGSKLV